MFALWMIGFLVLMAVFVWMAVVAGVPQLYIAGGLLLLLVIGGAIAVLWTKPRQGPPDP